MKYSRVVMFQGDAFDCFAMDAVTREDNTVFIYINGKEFEYEFDNTKTAQDKQSNLIQDWSASMARTEAYNESQQSTAQD